MKNKRHKVRFNLSKGRNYMKWKVEFPDGNVMYYYPTGIQLVMGNCTLKNHKKTADKIYGGANKSVCAWILCDTLELKVDDFIQDDSTQIRYNPKVQPNWLINGEVSDNKNLDSIHSIGYHLFTNSKL
jgi:hypothetical protein